MPPRREIKLPRCLYRVKRGKLKGGCMKAKYADNSGNDYMSCMELVKQGKCPFAYLRREAR